MRVIFPAETTREYKVIGPLTFRALAWLGAGAYAGAQPYLDHGLPAPWRDGFAISLLAAGAACAFVQWDGAYLPTWIVRLIRFWLRPKRWVLRP